MPTRRSRELRGGQCCAFRDPAHLAVKLPREFYDRPTLDVAHDLLGKVLVHRRNGVVDERSDRRGRGVHRRVRSRLPCRARAAPAETPRSTVLRASRYVYLNYGIHYLVNVVTEAEHSPAAVLIRALEPLEGVATMRRRRARAMKGRRPHGATSCPSMHLCRGPGNLTMAMGITLAENQLDLSGPQLFLEDRGEIPAAIAWGPRIGIRVGTERPWRAWIPGHPAVSAHQKVG